MDDDNAAFGFVFVGIFVAFVHFGLALSSSARSSAAEERAAAHGS